MRDKGIKTTVRQVLVEEPLARDDDHILWLEVIKKRIPAATIMSLEAVLTKYQSLGIPSFESVSRARRYIQADEPRLSSSKRIYEARKEEEERYRREYRI